MTVTRTALVSVAVLASGALILTGCGGSGGSSSSSSAKASSSAAAPTESPIGGGSASCDTNALGQLAQGAAESEGMTYVSTKEATCADGWALVMAITSENNIEQTTAFVFQAEGPSWALKQLDSVCGDNADGAPDSITSVACALR